MDARDDPDETSLRTARTNEEASLDMCRNSTAPTRRDLLKLGATAVAAGGVIAVTDLAAPRPALAQTPKRGGVLRLAHQLDPVGLDPHQTISFATMIPLSFIYSRLMKVKAGPMVKPGTYPVETDLAESWTQPSDTRIGVRTCLVPVLQSDSRSGGVAPTLSTVGFRDSTVRESRDRVRAAIRNAGPEFRSPRSP